MSVPTATPIIPNFITSITDKIMLSIASIYAVLVKSLNRFAAYAIATYGSRIQKASLQLQ